MPTLHTLPILFLALGPALSPAQGKRLTLEQTVGRGEPVAFGGELARWRWAPDGEHLVRGRGDEARWIDPRTWEESSPPQEPPSPDGAALVEALAAVEGVDAARAERIAKAPSERSEDGSVTLLRHGGDLWVVFRGGVARRLAQRGDPPLELVDLSPDGLRVACVRGNDLAILEIATGKLRSITSDGGEHTLNGKLDWVYQEEVFGRGSFKGFWWSPDSARIAFLRLDESPVHDFTVVDHVETGHFRVVAETTRYPKAGDPNPTVRLGVADVASGEIAWIDLGRYGEDEPLVVRVGWTPAGDRVLFMVQDRIQTWLDLDVADPATGEVTTLLRETSRSWTDRLPPPRWLADGSFLWVSDRTGTRHVYHHRADGSPLRAVTSGEWSLGSLLHVDEEAGRMWFTATKDGAVNDNVYRISLDGTGLVRLTAGEGRHRVTFNGDRSLFLDRCSSLAEPPRVRLCDGDGEVQRELATATVPDLEAYPTGPWELHEIRARDGFPLDVAVLKPVPFDPTERYPVWLSTYSGPNAPTVRNRWNASVWHRFLAQEGVIVLEVNVRSASGKGLFATEACYRQLGVSELADLEDAVSWLTSNPWADAEHVGIGGHSYGGFMAAFALTHTDAFALGIAGSGVYDWGMYDTIYTERYMRTPQLNPEGYGKASVLEAAANLHGHLVLTHGTKDDNVHVQNTLQLAYALQKAGKPFEMMLYPESRHGLRDRDLRWHLRRLEWAAIREHLLGAEGGWPEDRALEAATEASAAGAEGGR